MQKILAAIVELIARIPRFRWYFYDLVLDKQSNLFGKLRWHFWQAHMKSLGEGSFISYKVKIRAARNITIGKHTRINNYTILDGRGGLTIGDDVLIGFESLILSSSHRFSNPSIPIRLQGMESAPIKIGNDVWLGARVIILPGVTIGDGAVVGAGAVVTKNIPPLTIAVGVPARPIGRREQP